MSRPIPEGGLILTRHRYVNGKISAKCDYDSAVGAFRLYGGRIDRSTIVAYEAGDEHLGTWEQVWPPPVEETFTTPALAGEPKATPNRSVEHVLQPVVQPETES